MTLSLLFFSVVFNILTAQTWSELDYLLVDAYKKGDYHLALHWGKKAKQQALFEFGENHKNYAQSLNHLAIVYKSIGAYKKAEELHLKSQEIKLRVIGEKHPDYIEDLNNLAFLYDEVGRYKEAEQLYLKCKELIEVTIGKEQKLYAICLTNLGGLYREMGKYQDAEKLLLESLQIKSTVIGKMDLSYANTLNGLATLYFIIGRYEDAERRIDEALNIKRNTVGEEHLEYANVLELLANLYQQKGLYYEAEKVYDQVLSIKLKVLTEKHPKYAKSLSNKALLYKKMGWYEEAKALYQQSLDIVEQTLGKNHPEYAIRLNNLAILYKDLGKYEAVERLYQESLNIQMSALGEKHPLVSTAQHNLATFYMSMGLYEKAERLFLDALAITELAYSKFHSDYTTTLGNLAVLYHKAGLYEVADTLFQENRYFITETFGMSHPDYARNLNNHAFLYIEMEKNEAAEGLLLEHQKVITEIYASEENPNFANGAHNLGLLYLKLKRYEEAKPLLEKSLKIRGKVVGHKHLTYAMSLSDLAIYYELTDSVEQAVPLMIEAVSIYIGELKTSYAVLSESEKLQLLKNKISFVFQAFSSFYIRHAKSFPQLLPVLYNIDLQTKGLALSTSINCHQAIMREENQDLLDTYREWIVQRNLVMQMIKLEGQEHRKKGIDLVATEYTADSLEKILSKESKVFANQIKYADYQWRDVQERLKHSEVAISFIDFKYHNKDSWTDTSYYAALILRSEDDCPQFVQLCSEKELKKYLAYLSARKSGSYIEDPSIANELYQLIWEPLLPYLNQSATIYYSPSGLLNQISFQILVDGKGNFLNENYHLNQYTTLRDFIRPKQKKDSAVKSIVSFGGINYGKYTLGGWSELRNTLRTTNFIAKVFDDQNWHQISYTGTEASEKNMKLLSGKAPRILDIATHGFFLPDPQQNEDNWNYIQSMNNSYAKNIAFSQYALMRSGLVLAGVNRTWTGEIISKEVNDGIITSYEISSLDLSNTELVVLSACDTGLGDIASTEGVFGLQRAFKQAGVENIIMSLWEVPDKETTEFMKIFYTDYLKNQNIRLAFIHAQRLMAERYDPYYWAGFILVE